MSQHAQSLWFLVLMAFAGCANAKTSWSDLPSNYTAMTYGELARYIVPTAWQTMMNLVSSLTPTVMPGDVKPIRKSILALRNDVDIFTYAYPDSSASYKSDPLLYIRDLLDAGYVTIGRLRDLQESGINYTKKELVTRRCEILVWQADFEEKDAEHNFTAYLNSPKKHELTKRKASSLSSFFWRNTGIVPKKSDTGMETISKLEKALMKIAQSSLPALQQLSDLENEKQQRTMHDYRKSLRGILSISSTLPVWEDSVENSDNLDVLGKAYDSLGSCEDSINAYDFELKHGNKASQEKQKEKLNKKWSKLKKWLQRGDLANAISDLLDNMTHF